MKKLKESEKTAKECLFAVFSLKIDFLNTNGASFKCLINVALRKF